MDSVSIPMWIIRGALMCAAEEDVRYYICGVYFDFRAGRVVSTDGHILFVARIDKADRDSLLIHRDVLEIAMKSGSAEIEIWADRITAKNLPCDLMFKPIDGKFPDYSKVVPQKCSGVVCQFNPELVIRCSRALNSFSHRIAVLEHNGPDGGAVMTVKEVDAFCVIMPIRCDGLGDSRKWFYESPAAS